MVIENRDAHVTVYLAEQSESLQREQPIAIARAYYGHMLRAGFYMGK